MSTIEAFHPFSITAIFFLFLVFFPFAATQGSFTTPNIPGPDGDYSLNPIYTLNSTVTLSWISTFGSLNLQLLQQTEDPKAIPPNATVLRRLTPFSVHHFNPPLPASASFVLAPNALWRSAAKTFSKTTLPTIKPTTGPSSSATKT